MKLREITSSEDLTDSEKINAIATIVATARKAYGNTEAEITEPEVGTVDGLASVSLLSNESKVVLADSEITYIITTAVEHSKSTEGVVLDKEVERLIATSALLANLTKTLDSQYI